MNPLARFLAGLRFPQLFVVLAVLLLLDLAVPDFVPMLDEIVLVILTTMAGLLRRPAAPAVPAEKNVTPRDVTSK